jgi:hypothetical protein
MSKLIEVWDKYNPIFLIDAELGLKRTIDLNPILFRTCLELNINSEYVALSYDKFFISFHSLNIEQIQLVLINLGQFWNALAKQLPYKHDYHLNIYGTFYSKDSKNKYRQLVALGRRFEIVKDLEELSIFTFQKAMQASHQTLPF